MPKSTLFWDIDTSCLDQAAHQDFIIRRTLEMGDLDDLRQLFQKYPSREIKRVALKKEFVSVRNQTFWTSFFGHE